MNSKIKDIKYVIAVAVVVLLALAALTVSCFAFAGCTTKGTQPPTSEDVQQVYDMPDQLTFTAAALAANPTGITVQINATVQPSTAANKNVDWSVAWADGTASPNISTYLQIAPITNGSTTAKITCLAALPKDACITVTTREGSFTDICLVKFIGKPSTISATCATLTPSNNTYGFGVGVTYDFTVTMDNALHSVGSSFSPGVSIEATGNLTVGTYESDPRGSKVWYNERSANLSEFKDDIISYTIDGNTVHLTLNKSIEGYYSSKTIGGTVHTYYDRVKSVDSDCYFTVTIYASGVTGLNTSFKVTVNNNAVTGVNLVGTGELIF